MARKPLHHAMGGKAEAQEQATAAPAPSANMQVIFRYYGKFGAADWAGLKREDFHLV